MSKAVLAATIVALSGCSANTPIKAPELKEQPLPTAVHQPYHLAPNDLVAVRFWGNRDLDEEVRVRPDGMISLPFIDEVPAAGLTPQELDAELTRRYAGELADPQITIIVREAAARQVFVGGEVGRQGVIPLQGPLTLVQAIQQSGGFLTTARRKQVLLLRTTPDERLARSIDVRPILSGRDLGADLRLEPGDVIFVPRTRVTNVNLFMDQYVTSIVPLRPVLTIPVFDQPIFGSDEEEPPPASGSEEGGGQP